MTKRFRLHPTPLAGVVAIERTQIGDARGYLERLFCADELREAGYSAPIAQLTRTVTTQRGIVRGLHFQRPPAAEIKLVSCLRGEIFDVVVDLRGGSPTFLQWHAEILSETNHRALLIPQGCAHGFQSLSADCDLLYCLSAPYTPQSEDGINARDETLAIKWPAPIAGVSDRDTGLPRISKSFSGLAI